MAPQKKEHEAPQFSIVIPVYNTARYIEKCVDSILKQDYTDYELLLVDDGSTDESGAICDSYAMRDDRVRCLHQDNAGVSSARNFGLSEARGRYVWFCDSDDQITDGALSILAAKIASSSPPKMISFPVDQVDEDGTLLGRIPAPVPSSSRSQGPLQCNDLLYPYAHVFRRDLAENERFDVSLALLEDRDFFYRITWKAAGESEVITKPLYQYLITRKDSAVNSFDVDKHVRATRVQVDILLNEVALGHPMPAFKLFAEHSIGVLSLTVRCGASSKGYELVRNHLLRYRQYVRLLHGSLKIKYLLIIYAPVVFNGLTWLLGKAKGESGAGVPVFTVKTNQSR